MLCIEDWLVLYGTNPYTTKGPPRKSIEDQGGVHIRLVRGHPVFYAEHRRPTLKVPPWGGPLQGGYYAVKRHANLALLSLKGVAAKLLTGATPIFFIPPLEGPDMGGPE
jgi:hypothetical protein